MKGDSASTLQAKAEDALRKGDLVQAERIARAAASAAPDWEEALCLLATVCVRLGKRDEAVQLFLDAASCSPGTAGSHNCSGMASLLLGQPDSAIAEYQAALSIEPDAAETRVLLSNALNAAGRTAEADACLKVVREQHVDKPLPAAGSKSRAPQQRRSKAKPIGVSPGRRLREQARALLHASKYAEAEATYRKAIEAEPHLAEAHNGLGAALVRQHRLEDAEPYLRHAIALAGLHGAHHNLALCLNLQDRIDEAVQSARNALALRPADPEYLETLSWMLRRLGHAEESERYRLKSIAVRPNDPDTRFNHAVHLLREGRFREGWTEYDWRLRTRSFVRREALFTTPRWKGVPLNGRRLLVYGEQGLGDTIQFVRFLPRLAEFGGHVILERYIELRRLIDSFPGADEIIDRADEDHIPDVQHDLRIPLLSLPGLLGVELDTIPVEVPYLHADPQDVAFWSQKLSGDHKLRVGIAWAGNRGHAGDRLRSLPLTAFLPLASIPGVSLYSLQKGDPQLMDAGDGAPVTDLSQHLNDFADTAAAMEALDLIITVDTSVAHLAGALGRPVWTLISYESDWRWLRDRDDTPWYPTMRLFRQPALRDWASVFAHVTDELRTYYDG